jgi:hypothetical protein
MTTLNIDDYIDRYDCGRAVPAVTHQFVASRELVDLEAKIIRTDLHNSES